MKIALISCVKQKADKPQKARELYISSLFVKSLEYTEKIIKADKIFVLSAKYGLVPIDKVIEPYEKTLNNMKKNERVEWANEVLSELSKVSDIMKDEYYILAGKNYYENIYKRLKNVKIVMEGLQLGQRLQFLNKELSQ